MSTPLGKLIYILTWFYFIYLIGAYTSNSKGYEYIRKRIAAYIGRRDGVEANPDQIYLTNGASEGVRTAFTLLVRHDKDGILIPIP